MRKQVFTMILILLVGLFSNCSNKRNKQDSNRSAPIGLQKLEYNNPNLFVDLDVGFKSVPMPMDFDGDGDYDLLISESGCYAESGIFYFENISGNIEMPIFRYGMKVSSDRFRLGSDGKCFVTSYVGESTHVLTPDRVNEKLLMYRDVPQNVFWAKTVMDIPAEGVISNTKYNFWKMIDFDHDSLFDLICSVQSSSGNYILFFKNVGDGDNANFNKPQKIIAKNGELIGNDLFLEVPFADYDNDGDYDLIGLDRYSDLFYFENSGTPSNYIYTKGVPLLYKDEKIKMVSRYGSATKPRAIDFNKDGFVDIIAGDEDGKVSFLKNTGKIINGIPQFQQPKFFQQQAKFVDFGALSTPRVFDWDADGKDDIISGNGIGNIGFFTNMSDNKLKWDKPKLLQADGEDILILPDGANWGYTTIDVGYWNEDDLPDILVNDHHGYVEWFENIGTRSKPKLSSAKPIIVEWEGEPLKPEWGYGTTTGNELLAQWRTSPFIMDFNNDDLNDLVMLDHEGYLAVYLRFKENGNLRLAHPQRNFIFPDGKPILLNQRKKGSTGRLKITFADWDGDGLEDLVFSSKPAIDWMKNLGMKDGKMVLQYMGRIISKTLMGHTDGPVVSDFNKDGIPDLLVGTETGVFYYWERSSIDITTTMTTSGKQKPAKYNYFKR